MSDVKKLSRFIPLVLMGLCFSFYKQCSSTKSIYATKDPLVSQSHEQSLKQRLIDSSRRFNIDSLSKVIRSDNSCNVKNLFYNKKDSVLFVYDERDTKYSQAENQQFYSALCEKWRIAYATNINALTVCESFSQDSANSKTFDPKILFFVYKYNTGIADSVKYGQK